jgi:hypothetical protein
MSIQSGVRRRRRRRQAAQRIQSSITNPTHQPSRPDREIDQSINQINQSHERIPRVSSHHPIIPSSRRHIARTVVKDILVYITLRRIHASVCAEPNQIKKGSSIFHPSIHARRLETPRARRRLFLFLFLLLGGVFVLFWSDHS